MDRRRFSQNLLMASISLLFLIGWSVEARAGYYGQECNADTPEYVELNDGTDECSYRFTAQDSKTITQIRIYVIGYGTPPAATVGLKADSGGNPTGDYLSTSASVTPITSWSWRAADIADYAITEGTVYHIVIKSAAATATNFVRLKHTLPHHKKLSYDGTDDTNLNTLDYNVTDTTPDWAVLDKQPVFVLDYSDGTYTGNSYCITGDVEIYNDDTSDYRRAEVFTVSGTKSVTQVDFYIKKEGTPGSNLEYWLYDNTDGAHVVSGTLSPTTDWGWVSSASVSATLTDTHEYSLYLKYAGTDGSSTANYHWNMPHSESTAAPYDDITWGGETDKAYNTSDGGLTWTAQSERDGTFRFTLGGAIKIIIQKWRELYH